MISSNSFTFPSAGFVTNFVEAVAGIAKPVGEKLSKVKALFESDRINANVTYVGQIHSVPDTGSEDDRVIWGSQKKIAEYLRENRHKPIFLEGMNSTSPKYMHAEKVEETHRLFPEQLPENLDLLTPAQKSHFVRYGAAPIMHQLGIVTDLHPTISAEKDKEIRDKVNSERAKGNFDPLSPVLRPLFYDQREQALTEKVREFISVPGNKDREIIIIYGAAHNLGKYFNNNTFQYVKTP